MYTANTVNRCSESDSSNKLQMKSCKLQSHLVIVRSPGCRFSDRLISEARYRIFPGLFTGDVLCTVYQGYTTMKYLKFDWSLQRTVAVDATPAYYCRRPWHCGRTRPMPGDSDVVRNTTPRHDHSHGRQLSRKHHTLTTTHVIHDFYI